MARRNANVERGVLIKQQQWSPTPTEEGEVCLSVCHTIFPLTFGIKKKWENKDRWTGNGEQRIGKRNTEQRTVYRERERENRIGKKEQATGKRGRENKERWTENRERGTGKRRKREQQIENRERGTGKRRKREQQIENRERGKGNGNSGTENREQKIVKRK